MPSHKPFPQCSQLRQRRLNKEGVLTESRDDTRDATVALELDANLSITTAGLG